MKIKRTVDIKCRFCNKTFNDYISNHRKYCSVRCGNEASIKKIEPRKCVCCGIFFSTKLKGVKNCSEKCVRITIRNKKLLSRRVFYIKCVVCDDYFVNIRSNGKTIGLKQFRKCSTCSIYCSAKSKRKYNVFRKQGNICKVFLENKNVWTIIDFNMLQVVRHFRWYLDSVGYPMTHLTNKIGRKAIRLHELVMGDKRPFVGAKIDHINRNKLDNRKENLRFVTHWENLMNSSIGDRIRANHKSHI